MAFRKHTRTLACLFTLAWAVSLPAQIGTTPEYQVKAVFLYNFTRFVEWPASAFHGYNDPFIIGIIGDDPFGAYLDETVAGERYRSHPIGVRRFNDLKTAPNCHILYIGSHDREYIKRVVEIVEKKSVLTVTDVPGFFRSDGIVRFYSEGNKIRLQISVERSRAANLIISSKMLSVAKTD